MASRIASRLRPHGLSLALLAIFISHGADAQQGNPSAPRPPQGAPSGRTRPGPLPRPAAPAQLPAASPAPASQPANIDRNGVLILIRSALLALDQANKTGNYTVLRDLGAPGFQVNTAARLAEIFASQRAQGMDLAGVVVLEPQLTLLPQIEANGMLHMAGFFPSTPLQVNFEMLFAPSDRQWKIFGLAVNVSNSAPQAPQAPPGNPPPARQEPPPQPPSGAIGPAPAR